MPQTCIVVALVASFCVVLYADPGDITIKRDLYVTGALTSTEVVTKTMRTTGNAAIKGSVSASEIRAGTVLCDTIETEVLSSQGGTLVVEGNILLTSQPKTLQTPQQPTNPSPAALLVQDVVVGGVRQWQLVSHEDFDKSADGWSAAELGACHAYGHDSFLGGPCNLGGAHQTSKVYTELPSHSQVRVTAQVHFIDKWQGETALLRADGKMVWSSTSSALPAHYGIDVCGSEHARETRMAVPVDVTLPHAASTLELVFASTSLQEHPEWNPSWDDPCQRSFGVDNVMLYIR